MAMHIRSQLVVDALDGALHNRKQKHVTHYSDQGSQNRSIAFNKRCESAYVRRSTGSPGDFHDNAMRETSEPVFKCELLAKYRFATQHATALTVFDSVEGAYDPRRRYTLIGNIVPNEFKQQTSQTA